MTVKCNRTKAGRKATKPTKPRCDFPLYPHAVGKWAKTIRGRTYYFGTWEDSEGALTEYLNAKDDLYAGRTPSSKGSVSIGYVCNSFIRSKRLAFDSGRLSCSTLCDYDRCCRNLIDQLGATRSVLDLCPTDFEKLYAHLSRSYGPSTLGREITMTRSILRYAFESDLLDRPVKFGPQFRSPSKQQRRIFKVKAEQANGKKLFAAEEIQRMMDAAGPQLKAMILLGINGALGNSDVANLPLSALDLQAGWLDFVRVKTGTNRRIPLWPETVDALRVVIANRRKPANSDHENLLFLTKFGKRWVENIFEEVKRFGKTKLKFKRDNALAKEFSKLLETLGLKRRQIGFYALRHTFETIGDGCRDQVAVDSILGHSDPTMAAESRPGIEDSRLQAVVEHVRQWLFTSKNKKERT
jgi:integrase